MEKFRLFLAGYKTYLAAVSAVLVSLIAYANGEIQIIGVIEAVITATGLASLRAGITNEVKGLVE